jgi:hypothetical protein
MVAAKHAVGVAGRIRKCSAGCTTSGVRDRNGFLVRHYTLIAAVGKMPGGSTAMSCPVAALQCHARWQHCNVAVDIVTILALAQSSSLFPSQKVKAVTLYESQFSLIRLGRTSIQQQYESII